MRFGVVGYLIAHPRTQREDPAVSQLGVELALGTKQDVPLDAPMIGEIARRVLHHAHADSPEDPGPPERHAALASMLRALDLRPVGRTKRYGGHVHETTRFPQRISCNCPESPATRPSVARRRTSPPPQMSQ